MIGAIRHPAKPSRRPTSWTRPPLPASTTSTTASSRSSSAAESPCFDCNDDDQPDLYLAGGTNPAGLYRNESPIGGALRFARLPDAGDRPDRRGRRLSRSTSTRTASIDLAVLRLGENVLLRGLGDCRFERANEAWEIDGGDAWTAAFSATWEDEPGPAHPRLRQLRDAGQRGPTGRRMLRQRLGPTRFDRTAMREPDARWPRAGAPCRFSSATGTARAGATCG